MKKLIPGYTFSDLQRQPELEVRHARCEWRDNMGNLVPPPEGGVFAGRLSYGPHIEASVVRNGYSRGGYLGLYEIAFLNPAGDRGTRDFYEPIELELQDVTLTWLNEEQVTKVLQLVAREIIDPPPIRYRLIALALAVCAIISALAGWLLTTGTR